ncbi:uncharacterized protein NECHADRAFT_55615 [Fusarium vanettenii 77-13-4]|uniref:Uncharacterized protein n=1 Tax=Fusarium vanettenii (strain ATCC MYA-4622 / CBS 123669 / FGSC 9596 / NRRL 45880 / 77-13-4) TaxID=660122 RepID=C7ZML5_FUSV7|nr:uncharacterized protein NECHADRAFT_56169 [Fusarium vanettenii 77-13-4]XP_003040455.1 uncharacterized protein NECHADRAFT_55615 [Fusarium vanettenii 77-13-4]EEU33340.1 predicted protein [Fusarium vanettenii 77-13-4]EEU34742.1 predicted protein [Fusarium vanettenii 77-13-4]
MYKEDANESDADDAASDDSHLIIHVRVFALAEKYDILPLKVLSLKKFKAIVRLR